MVFELSLENLHDYQELIVNQVLCNNKRMLWVDMGLGKTISVLTIVKWFHAMQNGNHKFLIVAPVKVVQLVWKQETAKWEHTHNIKVLGGDSTAKKRQDSLFSDHDIYLCSYESLGWLQAQLEHYYLKKGLPLPFYGIVYDEITKMKNPKSKRFKAWSMISNKFQFRLGMTGTPMPNGYADLWSQYFLVTNGHTLGFFYDDYMTEYFKLKLGYNGGRNYKIYEEKPDTGDKVADLIKDVTLVISVKDHGQNLNLPTVTYIKRQIKLTNKVDKQFANLKKDLATQLSDGSELVVKNQTALLSKLLQFSGGRVYNIPDLEQPEHRVIEYVHDESFNALDEMLEELGDINVLICYMFNFEREEILRRHDDAVCLTGTSPKEAIRIIKDFETGKIKKLLIHPASAGHGLNLQKACSTLIWFNVPMFDLDLWQQTNGRVNRQGQQQAVRIFIMQRKNTMDDVVYKSLVQKQSREEGIKDLINVLC